MNTRTVSRFGGTLAAAGLMLAQLAAFPVSAAAPTAKDISTCDYVTTFEGGKVITQAEGGGDMSLVGLGVPLDETVSEIWIDVSMDASSGKPAMPAMGYSCPGYVNPSSGEQTDWYGDGYWMNSAMARSTIVFEIPEDAPVPDTFSVQIWGTPGDTVDTMTLNAIGINTGAGGGDIGMMTRKGDVNNDKTVTIDDVSALAEFLLVGSSNGLVNPANADLDHTNRLNAKDLTLLKRGILDGSLTSTSSNDETAMEFVSHIKLGWNLGNTLDAVPIAYSSPYQAETSWGCPMTTKAIIDTVKAAGFNTVRVPVSWGQKMNSETYQIDEAWMNRVQEVVNYVIDNDMYCILNIHHDNSQASYPYFYPDNAHYQQSEKFVKSVWSQIADRFEAYDSHLIFETLNEPRLVGHKNEWWIDPASQDCIDAMNNINKLNAAALGEIRSSGGNNEKRFVMMPTYSASPDTANLNGMVMPNDDHLIAEIHAYRPYLFALANDGTQKSNWDPQSDAGEVVTFMNDLKSRYLSKGIPVIIDEFGAMNRNNEDDRAAWVKFYLETASSFDIPCVWWDNNAFDGEGENFGLINRNTLTVQYPKIMDAMLEATKNRGNQ